MTKDKDVFDLLSADHAKVSALLTQLKDTREPSLRKTLLGEVENELEVHASAEEESVYSTLRRIEITEDIAAEAEDEHDKIRTCLEILTSLDVEDENWETALSSLEKTVKRHVKKEESEMFDAMREHFDNIQLEEMRDQFLAVKRDLKGEIAA